MKKTGQRLWRARSSWETILRIARLPQDVRLRWKTNLQMSNPNLGAFLRDFKEISHKVRGRSIWKQYSQAPKHHSHYTMKRKFLCHQYLFQSRISTQLICKKPSPCQWIPWTKRSVLDQKIQPNPRPNRSATGAAKKQSKICPMLYMSNTVLMKDKNTCHGGVYHGVWGSLSVMRIMMRYSLTIDIDHAEGLCLVTESFEVTRIHFRSWRLPRRSR